MITISRSLRSATLMVALAFVVTGCGSSKYTILQPATEPLDEFSVLQINDFTSNLTDEDSVNLAGQFADRLHEAVLEERADNPGKSVFDEVSRGANTGASQDVLVLDGTLIAFEKGSRAKRYFIGFGAGKAYCTIQATFTNKATGEVVLKSNFDGELSMSFFGGDADEAVEEVVDAFIDYFSDYFTEQGWVEP